MVIVQDYFIQWEISFWMLAWVVLLAILSLSSFLKHHFGWGFIYGVLALFSLNGQFHFLTVSNSVVILSSILAVIDVTFSTVIRYLNDQHFTHGSADVSLGEASVYFDNCRIEGPVCPV